MIDGTHGTITQGWPLKHFRCTFTALSPQSPECREESCKHLKTEYPAFTALFYAHVFFFKVDYIIQQMSKHSNSRSSSQPQTKTFSHYTHVWIKI